MKRLSWFVSIFPLVLAAQACGGDASSEDDTDDKEDSKGGSSNINTAVEQRNEQCPASPTKLTGSKKKGASCTSASECAPSCCQCGLSDNEWLGAACVDGECVSACDRVDDSNYCDGKNSNPGVGSSSSSSGSSSGRVGPSSSSSSSSGSSGSSTSGTRCVEGTSTSCYGTGKRWTGELCCVDDVTYCVEGTSTSCYGTGKHWTGELCCIEPEGRCVDGTSTSCYGTDMYWTGKQCCVAGASQCVEGTSTSCYGTGKHWTGELCCVD